MERVAESGEGGEALGFGPAVGLVVETEEEGVFGGWRRQQPSDGRGGKLGFGEDEGRVGVDGDAEEAATGLMNPDGFAAAKERKAGEGGKVPDVEVAGGVGRGGRPTESVVIGDPDRAATEGADGPDIPEAAEAGGGELGKQGGMLPVARLVSFDVADRIDRAEPETVGEFGGGGREGTETVGGRDVDCEPLRAIERGEDVRTDENRAVAAAGDGADVALDGAGAGFVQERDGTCGAEVRAEAGGDGGESGQDAECQGPSRAEQHWIVAGGGAD